MKRMRTRMGARWIAAPAAAGILAVALAGCGTPAGVGDTPSPTGAETVGQTTSQTGGAPSSSADPSAVVGAWTVSATGTDDDGQVMYISNYSTMYRSCGTNEFLTMALPDGTWRAQWAGGSGDCVADTEAPWLSGASRYQTGADGVDLIDGTGAVLAHLTAGGTPEIPDSVWAESVVVPTLSPDQAARLAPERPALPDGMVAPTSDQIVGAWSAPDATEINKDAGATFAADGSWTGSDGCNGQQGVWGVGPDGWWRAVAGAQTLIGCDNIDVGGMLAKASQVGLADDGQTFVFLDGGKEIGRLIKG